MKVIISGNNHSGLSGALGAIIPNMTFCSRETDFELTSANDQRRFAKLATEYDVVIICSALWKFQQTVLLDEVHKACTEANVAPHIVCIGSTTDRVNNGRTWRYNAEKKALRDYSNTCAIQGVWTDNKPKVSYISFGTLSNNQHKHPDRKCIDIDQAAEYIKWLLDQPKHININEISIDPMQGESWYE